MKTKIFSISLLTGLSLTTTAIAAPAGGGGGGGGAAAPAAPARIVPSTVVPAQHPQPGGVPPGSPANQTGGTTTPGSPNQTEGITATETTTMSSNSPAMTSTNQFAATPTNGVSANSNTTANINSNPANNNLVFSDQAVTSGDRMLLNTLQTGLAAQLGTSAGALPVHFLINNGMVTLVGTVRTTDESQRVLARVQQTPGVVSVFNDVRVGNAPTSVQPRNNLTGTAGISDRAFTPADQTLLTVVEQAAGNQLGITGASATQMPVHFSVQNGVVGVTGQLSSPQEKAAILAAIQHTPGVVRVVDNVALINVPQNGGVPGASPLQTPPMNQTQPLQPTSRSMGLTNSQFLNTSNQGF